MKKLLLKLNKANKAGIEIPILIGIESIISAEQINHSNLGVVTKITSRGAMVESNYVTESIEEIYEQYNKL